MSPFVSLAEHAITGAVMRTHKSGKSWSILEERPTAPLPTLRTYPEKHFR